MEFIFMVIAFCAVMYVVPNFIWALVDVVLQSFITHIVISMMITAAIVGTLGSVGLAIPIALAIIKFIIMLKLDSGKQ